MMLIFLFFSLTIAGLSFLMTVGLRRFAIRRGLLDHPNHRSSHELPTPRVGGVGFVSLMLLTILGVAIINEDSLEVLFSIMIIVTGVSVTGFFDDLYNLPSSYRAASYSGVVLIALYFLPSLPNLSFYFVVIENYCLLLFLYFLGIFWLLNLFNFMDGIDGITALESIYVLLCGAFLVFFKDGFSSMTNLQDAGVMEVLAFLLVVSAAAVSGFLISNWPPATIFMGDVGSSTLGAFIGFVAVVSSTVGDISVWHWLIITATFWVDSTFTLFRRLIRREKIWSPHKRHAYQILAGRWKSHKKVTLLYSAVNIFWLLPLLLIAISYSDYVILLTVIASVPLFVFVFLVGAGSAEK
ncbi:MraY family glycosyltransferase [Hahella ganghwensis]|uniref:MraY family glycosyltransferase n=1 Tax=Hahella ganghwensis TaxID=286420 RepID=UPI0012FBCF7C|nr:glycosyltransferase family 4 protein [Hahella ganghwensis]